MITFNRLVNIIVFQVLVYNWEFDTIDYIKEKYFNIFNKYPDNICKDFDFNGKIIEFKKSWLIDNIDDDDIKILNFCYNLEKIKTLEKLKPNDYIKIYDDFFKSYDTINNSNQIKLLHYKLKEEVNEFIDNFEIFKFLYIRQKITLNNK